APYLDSRFRGNDKPLTWIPASAGMTSPLPGFPLPRERRAPYLDSRFRGNDKPLTWIPASAGMTSPLPGFPLPRE
ncbi:MAG: hypothetical protein RIR53_709, partial [Bacteroidota bacterium]